jgi:MinD-like ATPase involved in chromosome partitioning or flagellar assembly
MKSTTRSYPPGPAPVTYWLLSHTFILLDSPPSYTHLIIQAYLNSYLRLVVSVPSQADKTSCQDALFLYFNALSLVPSPD